MNWGSREECHYPSTLWRGKKFLTSVIYEESTWYVVKFCAQKLAIVFQHKSLFSLVKDLFKWIEGLGRSVTFRVQSEEERIFDLIGVREKYLIRCQFSRSNTRYKVFQHKSLSLFNLAKDLFKWIEGLERSVTVRVQYEGKEFLT